jgi:chromate reductase
MENTMKLLGISGSLRKGSFNTMLVKEAARLFDPSEFTLADIRFPLYDGDIEASEGLPEPVQTLIAQINDSDCIVISTPEYNSNISGVLKNALDWISRSRPMPLGGKPVAILSAAAGRTGGARSQFSLRHCLTPFRPNILQGPEMLVAGAHSAFDDDGRLKDETTTEILGNLMDALKKA